MGKTSAWLPVAMSLTALGLVLGYVAVFGVVQHEDEGAAAHLFQLLMGGQVPIVAYFIIRWLPQKPKQALLVLLLQIITALMALAPVCYFNM
jgi:hypothetical protein